jgi:predicted transcriptional regulator of viral defense system
MYRINELIKLERKIYHSNDLAILWHITNKNTLYTTIKRYVQKGVLVSIYKGLYSTLPLSQLDPLDLGKAIIHRYTYLSTESVLAQAGVIAQPTYVYTFVSSLPKKVSVENWSYLFRQLKPEFLYNPIGISDQNGVLVASAERAAADLLYFNPRYHFDVPESIDRKQVEFIQKEIGYPC